MFLSVFSLTVLFPIVSGAGFIARRRRRTARVEHGELAAPAARIQGQVEWILLLLSLSFGLGVVLIELTASGALKL